MVAVESLFAVVLAVCHRFQPGDVFVVFPSDCHGQVGHLCLRGGSVPMFYICRTGDDVARAYFNNRAAVRLSEADSRCDDEALSARMNVSVSARSRLEGYV